MSGVTDVPAKRVTVIGGGFTGAIFAHHLLRESQTPVAVDIVEERAILGAGVAYSALGPHQTTNIPAPRMSVYPHDRPHFERWLAQRDAVSQGEEEHYPSRRLFGLYMDDLLRTTEPANSRSVLHHRRTRVASVDRGEDFAVRAVDGTSWHADAVALATGNPAPIAPPPLARLAHDPRVVMDPWQPDSLARMQPDDRVLIVGVGLTMGEAVGGMRARGHRGEVVAIARRGRRPERGMISAPSPFGDFASHRHTTTVALLRHFRAEVRRAEAVGLSWRSAAVAVRAHGWDVWGSLTIPERRRFVRHLRPYWEALRHVMPGAVHDMLLKEERLGRLRVLAASLKALDECPDGIHASLHRRGTTAGELLRERFDMVVNCTGPAYATVTETDPFWAGLARAGLVGADEVRLGIAVDRSGRAIDQTGAAQPDVLILGTLARGTFGELTGVPELSRQAREAARSLASSWAEGQHASPEHLLLDKAV